LPDNENVNETLALSGMDEETLRAEEERATNSAAQI
jgi:hypothetical protein